MWKYGVLTYLKSALVLTQGRAASVCQTPGHPRWWERSCCVPALLTGSGSQPSGGSHRWMCCMPASVLLHYFVRIEKIVNTGLLWCSRSDQTSTWHTFNNIVYYQQTQWKYFKGNIPINVRALQTAMLTVFSFHFFTHWVIYICNLEWIKTSFHVKDEFIIGVT